MSDKSSATASLQKKTVVITGASSGLGRALAIAFSREGARVVLAARNSERLEQTAQACRSAGGEALTVVTDVTHEAQVTHLADEALRLGGTIDAWVNNAGVTLFAPLASGSFDEHRRVIETNLYGPMLAARAVMPIFKRQGHGVMINVGSVLSKIGHPFVPSYAISKFALRGLSEALRVELADEPDIHVCTAMPYAMNTPHFESGANRIGLRARSMPPDQLPEKVAREIVALVKRPRRELLVPRSAALGLAMHALLPETTEALLLHALKRWHFDPAPEQHRSGNLFEPDHREDDVPGAHDGIHGQREPRLSAARLVLWALGDLLRSSVRPAPRGVGGPHRSQAAL